MTTDICFMSATQLVHLMRRKELSARQVMEAHIDQIQQINPRVNAIVTFLPELGLKLADAADKKQMAGENTGVLHGLPVAHKDLVDTKGILTTLGSPIFKNRIPTKNALIVDRLQKAGAITIGKTNTPEFGAGSQTFNPVFGETCNPYDMTKTCGGSSGGAAAALACGMLPIADGSDTGGSLRNPANFCNIVGLRPSPGRVPDYPNAAAWYPVSVQGPMARTVQDVALMLSAIAGPDPRSPISITTPAHFFSQPLERNFKGTRIAWSRDLGGLPVDSRVTQVIDSHRHVFESLGCRVEDEEPDFSNADDIFKVMRAWFFALLFGKMLKTHRDHIKDTVIWNIEQGLKLTGVQIGEAEKQKTALYHRVRKFMETYEFLICPVNQVLPFDIKQPSITRINNVKMETYIDWMKSCYYITVTGHPAISVPCGFTAQGLPVGVQIVGRHQDELGVLQLAYAFEQATHYYRHRPDMASLSCL
ncbi:MAG: amidase [Proteobacteria bacterium]|nr:amidase [Pseudomonadota bacterium]MBU1386546.1 amidase [Pseudomonadota bacterium]MBU1544657.1 amidase [Pseudomonadota bacterium]MBU2431728.1 amidase [Pseudomonadota bacterium]MBU2481364.1 amidase [Pseudomonadota bacterium]